MSRPEMTEAEKAEAQLRDFVQAVQSYDVRASDFIAYLLRNLKPGALAGLAQDWDDSQADAPRPWVIQSTDPHDLGGELLYWSNLQGWVDKESADRFTCSERCALRLPIHGAWVRMEGGSK